MDRIMLCFFYSLKYGYLSQDYVLFCSTGMEVYPVRPSFLESIPKSLFAGVVGGLCFLCVAIILSFGTACYMRKRRSRKQRKRRQGTMLCELLLCLFVDFLSIFAKIGFRLDWSLDYKREI